MFWVLRSGSPWADVPERYGPPTTIYNRFNRWRKAGIWDRLMDAIIAAHDGKVQMIDSTVVRVHQQAAAQKKQAGDACIGRSRGGLTTKLHVRVVGNGLPVQLELSPGQANDAPMAELLLNDLPRGAVVLADRAYDADWIHLGELDARKDFFDAERWTASVQGGAHTPLSPRWPRYLGSVATRRTPSLNQRCPLIREAPARCSDRAGAKQIAQSP
ncbi:MAG: hypothetical protein B7Y08_08060 [Rhodospirillales bacterium 24-66-33]|nr:MAG: hypothetical protein B7Y08_08060 [Rhodospirillales bacterium 24-66-33]